MLDASVDEAQRIAEALAGDAGRNEESARKMPTSTIRYTIATAKTTISKTRSSGMATTPQTNVTLAEFAEALDRFEFCLVRACEPRWRLPGLATCARACLAPPKGKRAVCLLAHDDAVDKSFLFLPGANELIPACGIPRATSTPSSQLTCPILSVWVMRLAFMKARARISRLITMRLKAAWQNTIR